MSDTTTTTDATITTADIERQIQQLTPLLRKCLTAGRAVLVVPPTFPTNDSGLTVFFPNRLISDDDQNRLQADYLQADYARVVDDTKKRLGSLQEKSSDAVIDNPRDADTEPQTA